MMAQALRAVADALEKPQAGEQGSDPDESRDSVSAARSLGAEMVSAPLEVAAAAIGAVGDIVTSAVGVPSGESRKGGPATSSRE
jgi:hypothetical protein